MSPIVRTWIAFAAIGAGLIHVALVVGSPLPLGIPLAVLGLAEFGWGVLTFSREKVVLPRLALVVAIVPVLAWALVLVTSSVSETPSIAASLGFLPLAVASFFGLFIAAVLAVHLRRGADAGTDTPGVARYLISLMIGALAVAGLTTPALAATEAGTHAIPHGTTTEFVEPHVLPSHITH